MVVRTLALGWASLPYVNRRVLTRLICAVLVVAGLRALAAAIVALIGFVKTSETRTALSVARA